MKKNKLTKGQKKKIKSRCLVDKNRKKNIERKREKSNCIHISIRFNYFDQYRLY